MAKDAGKTKRELIAGAGPVFARKGFEAASVREICSAAGANVAAVSYHFGGKEGLYKETLIGSHRRALDSTPMPRFVPDMEPFEALRTWLAWFLNFLYDDSNKPAWLPRLIVRELGQPTAALDDLVEHGMRPVFTQLAAILSAIFGPETGPDRIRQAAQITVGPCVFFVQSRAIVDRLGGPGSERPQLIESVITFVIGGVRALADERAARKAGQS